MTVLSVVIPAYNEEEGIAQIVTRVLDLRPVLARQNIGLETIVVDDGSSDQTATRVAAFKEVRLVRHLVNRGYGAAIKTGFRHATGEYLAFLDADGTYPPESLPELLRVGLAHNADMVVGSRMMGAHSKMPLMRRLGNFGYARLLSMIGNVRVSDTASGMRIIRRSCLERLYPLPDGLQFTPAMSTRAIHENLSIVEVPIPYAERVGRSKLSVVRDGFRFTNAIVWTALAYNPVRILGLIALGMLGLAVVIGLYIVAQRIAGVTEFTPLLLYAFFVAVLLVIVGTSVFSLGAMFNYLVALFHKHPMRQGLFGQPIFKTPLDRQFGWLGLVSAGGGMALSVMALVFSLNGWGITRLWFYLLISALLVVIGVQWIISWLVMRILEELAQREQETRRDLDGQAASDEAR